MELGITVSEGISWNKIYAKLGSDYKKPDAITEFNRENYKSLIWKLPASDLLYVGRSTHGLCRSMVFIPSVIWLVRIRIFS